MARKPTVRQYNRFDVLLKLVHKELSETSIQIQSLYATNEERAILKKQVPELEKTILYLEGKTEWTTEQIADILNEEQEQKLKQW